MSAAESAPQPQEQKKPLKEIFEQFTTDAAERFPHLKGRLLIADTNEYHCYGAVEIDTEKTGLTKETAPSYLKNTNNPNEYASYTHYDSTRGLHSIFFKEEIDGAEFNGVSKKTEKHIMYVLDHELAHFAIPDGRSEENNGVIAESIADAYALIRHFQRFGADSEHYDRYVDPSVRASRFIMHHDKRHLTSFVLDEIIKKKDLIDFNRLDHEKTVDLAWRVATNYVPSAVKVMADITLDTKSDYYTFKLGAIWLRGFLKGDIAIRDGSPEPSKEFMNDVSKKLKEREFKLAQEDILFNMPVVTKAPDAAKKPSPARRKKAPVQPT
jgi:hypothetical protein